jgi:cobalt-zinc-cadmium efflux system protein
MAQDHQGHDDHHHGHHHHGSPGETTVGRLGAAAAINVGFAIVQVLVGLALGSIVVLADALHQVTDAVGLLTALVALWLTSRPSDGAMTFGWGKADALGGYTSALLLLASVAWIVIEAIDRLRNPTEVSGTGVILIGVAGIIVNGGSVVLLGHGQQLALRAARLHLLVDLAGSVIVVVSGALLLGTSLDWIDPAASLLVNALVLHGTVRILRAASAELLDRTPAGAEPDRIRATLLAHPEIGEVHHVHSRALAPGVVSVTAHVVLDGHLSVHEAQTELDRVRHALADELDIHHTTLQLECHDCGAVSHG